MIFSRLASTPAPSSGEDETLTRHKVFPGRRKQSGGPIDTSTVKTLGGPGRSAGHRSPCPIKAKKKKQTSLIREVIYQHLYLVTGCANHRSRTCTWRPKPNQSSLRGQAYGSSPSKQPEHFPVSLQTSQNFYMKSSQTNSRTKPRRSATTRPRTSTKICCGSTAKRSGATVGDVTPGYP